MAEKPLTGPVEFQSTGSTSEERSTKALEFIATRLAGVEWQLVKLNEKLFRIAAAAQTQAGGEPRNR